MTYVPQRMDLQLKRKRGIAPSPFLPCPFCGGTDIEIVVFDHRDREGLPAARQCSGCGCQGPWDYIPNEGCTTLIDKLWNDRVAL